jgi:diadenosine tetraphosphate (Ap4A) HIT family hydrolase
VDQAPADFRAKFRVDELLLFRNDGWSLSLRPEACTLGASVLSANREHGSLGEIGPTEAADLAQAVRWFETRVRAAFGADKFNYLALMMVDAQVHFHALPRYGSDRAHGGLIWRDEGWPKAPQIGVDQASGDALIRVRDALVTAAR